MSLFAAFLPSFLLAYDVGRLWPLKLLYVINLRAAADVAVPKGVLLPDQQDKWLQSREMLKRYLFQGRLWPVRLNVWRLRDVLMEPGDWEILGLHRDEILTRERVTARWEVPNNDFASLHLDSTWPSCLRFKRLAKETHPDRPNGDTEQFQKLQMAFKRALKSIEVYC